MYAIMYAIMFIVQKYKNSTGSSIHSDGNLLCICR